MIWPFQINSQKYIEERRREVLAIEKKIAEERKELEKRIAELREMS